MTPRSLGAVGLLPQAALAVLLALLAAGVLLSIFLADKIIALAALGAVGLVLAFTLSGNHRLFCLWGLLLVAPLDLSKNFMPIPHMGGAGAYSIELADIFLVPLMLFLARDFAQGRRRGLRLSAVTGWWLALIGLGLLAVLMGPLRHVAAQEVLRMIKCLLIFLVVVNEVVRVRQFLHVVAALAAGIVAQALIGILQYLMKANLGLEALGEATAETIRYASRATYLGGTDVYRIGALLGHPNMLAAYMALLVPICIALLFSRINVLFKLGAGIAAALGGITLVLTLSRSGWLSFGVAFVSLLALSFVHPRMRRRFLFARVGLIGLVTTFVLVFSGPIFKRFTESDPNAVNFRYEWMEVAWKMVVDHPVLGVGLNSFVFNLPGYTRYGGIEGLTQVFGANWPVVHNTWLLTWSEQGTLGFLVFVGLHLAALRIGWLNTRRADQDILFAINLGCLAGVLAIMADGMASFFLRSPAGGRMFWIVLGLMVAVNFWHRINPPQPLARSLADIPPLPPLPRRKHP